MKKIRFIFAGIIAIALLAVHNPSLAQKKSKEEKAEEKLWKKKLKETSPMQYKTLVEDKENLEKEVSELRLTSNKLQEAEKQLAAKEEENRKLQTQVSTLQQSAKSNSNVNSEKGIVFKVQIGAYKMKDLSSYDNGNGNFNVDTAEDGTQKYTIGVFTDYWEADKFKKYMQEMGVKDAWIASYKDGQRIDIKDALKGVI